MFGLAHELLAVLVAVAALATARHGRAFPPVHLFHKELLHRNLRRGLYLAERPDDLRHSRGQIRYAEAALPQRTLYSVCASPAPEHRAGGEGGGYFTFCHILLFFIYIEN